MPAKGGFALTEGDVEMLSLIHELRFAKIENLSLLASRSYKKVQGRLLRLYANKYLSRIERPQQKDIYVLGATGAEVLVERGLAKGEILEERRRHTELKDLFLNHELLIADTHSLILHACKGNPLRLLDWREG